MPGSWEFPYTSFDLRPSPAFPEGRRILRPVVTTLIVCPRGFTALDAIIDTGADHCVFPLTTARELDLDIGSMPSEQIAGVAGGGDAFYDNVRVFIAAKGGFLPFNARVGFMDTGPYGLLGGAGLFDTFSVRLDKWRGTFTIFPKG